MRDRGRFIRAEDGRILEARLAELERLIVPRGDVTMSYRSLPARVKALERLANTTRRNALCG